MHKTTLRVTDSIASRTRGHRRDHPGFDTPHMMLPANWDKQVRDYNKWKRSTKKTGGRRPRKTRRHTRRH